MLPSLRWLFVLCSLRILHANADGLQHRDAHSLVSTKHLDNLFNEGIAKLQGKSNNVNTAKDAARNCTKACSFQMSFDSPMQRPINCTERVLGNQCIVHIYFLYDVRTILVYFRTVGTESSEVGYTLYTYYQLLHTFNTNASSLAMACVCFVGDDCDWAYATNMINRYTKTNFYRVFNELRPLLLETSNTAVSQCYSQNSTMNCTNGRCFASVNEDSLEANRSCSISTGTGSAVEIRRRRIFPTPPLGELSVFAYICNRNMCNDPNSTNAVKDIIQSYASYFYIPALSESASLFNQHAKDFIILWSILCLIHSTTQ
jgi:hypothetical protein